MLKLLTGGNVSRCRMLRQQQLKSGMRSATVICLFVCFVSFFLAFSLPGPGYSTMRKLRCLIEQQAADIFTKNVTSQIEIKRLCSQCTSGCTIYANSHFECLNVHLPLLRASLSPATFPRVSMPSVNNRLDVFTYRTPDWPLKWGGFQVSYLLIIAMFVRCGYMSKNLKNRWSFSAGARPEE